MDSKALVNEIRKVLTTFMQNEFTINVAMLIKDLEHDTYTFILSSYFLDILTPYDGTKFVAEYFYNNLSKDTFGIISRINLVNTLDPSIQLLMSTLDISGSIVDMKNVKLSNNLFNVILDDAILFESHKNQKFILKK